MYIWRSAAFISARSLTRDPTLWLITLRCVQINYVRQWNLLPTTVFLVYLEIRVVYCCCRDANHSEEFVKCGLSFLHDIYKVKDPWIDMPNGLGERLPVECKVWDRNWKIHQFHLYLPPNLQIDLLKDCSLSNYNFVRNYCLFTNEKCIRLAADNEFEINYFGVQGINCLKWVPYDTFKHP